MERWNNWRQHRLLIIEAFLCFTWLYAKLHRENKVDVLPSLSSSSSTQTTATSTVCRLPLFGHTIQFVCERSSRSRRLASGASEQHVSFLSLRFQFFRFFHLRTHFQDVNNFVCRILTICCWRVRKKYRSSAKLNFNLTSIELNFEVERELSVSRNHNIKKKPTAIHACNEIKCSFAPTIFHMK